LSANFSERLSHLSALLAGRNGLIAVAALLLLVVILLVLWLRARAGAGNPALRQELKAAQNQVRLLKGDAMQASRDHAAALDKLNKELETLRAVAGGKIPPELEEWRRRALEAEAENAAVKDRHRKEVQILEAALGRSSTTGTIIAPSSQAARERMERVERELAEARRQLESLAAGHRAELTALAERLGAEKAAALSAQAERHARELERLRGAGPGSAPPALSLPAIEGGSNLPDSARFTFLETVAGGTVGEKFYLLYGTTSIGRDEENTVTVTDALASRYHADIVFDGVDFTLKDKGSTNGTYLNDQPVTIARLNFGDVVGVGELRLRFGCAASDAIGADPDFAAAAFEAMLQIAPSFRLALRELAGLLTGDPSRAAQVQEVEGRLTALSET
jgi:hypothetical protein